MQSKCKCVCMLAMKRGMTVWVRSAPSLGACAHTAVPAAAARPKQRLRASLSACQDFGFTEPRRLSPDRLDQFLQRSTHKHLNNNEARLTPVVHFTH